MSGRHRLLVALVVASLLGICGCRTVITYTPEPPAVPDISPLRGHIEYKGNPDYLPKMLVETDAPARETDLRFHYTSKVSYHHASPPFFSLVGFGLRGVGVDVAATATLDAFSGEDRKRFDAACVVKLRRSIFVWGYPTQTELRRRALLAVRDMIDEELAREWDGSAAAHDEEGAATTHPRRQSP